MYSRFDALNGLMISNSNYRKSIFVLLCSTQGDTFAFYQEVPGSDPATYVSVFSHFKHYANCQSYPKCFNLLSTNVHIVTSVNVKYITHIGVKLISVTYLWKFQVFFYITSAACFVERSAGLSAGSILLIM